nr:calretinin isoform X1 [Dasypus novemcinctus]
MAGPQQQPPYLHLAELTASQFLEIWKHFDADGNGYIEGKELENFFQELEKARRGSGMMSKSDNFGEKMKEFMQKYDKNSDGKIEMAELAQILPTEENFLLCFRQHVGSSAEFMEAWRKYDTDRSGYIEANELKGFLSDLLKKANRPYDEPKLQEYTQTILRMFDLNGDGKLGLSEMSRLLPVQENFLLKFQGMKLTSEEFNAIFTFYDKVTGSLVHKGKAGGLITRGAATPLAPWSAAQGRLGLQPRGFCQALSAPCSLSCCEINGIHRSWPMEPTVLVSFFFELEKL